MTKTKRLRCQNEKQSAQSSALVRWLPKENGSNYKNNCKSECWKSFKSNDECFYKHTYL